MGGSTFRRTPISRSPLDKNPMPGHHSELHPVNEVNTKEKKSRPQKGPQKKFIIIDKLDAIRHETLGTNPEGTVHNLENKI